MSQKNKLNELIFELDLIHSSAGLGSPNFGDIDFLPNFVTASNGTQRHLNRKVGDLIRAFTETLHANDRVISSMIEVSSLNKIVTQCIADFHAIGRFIDSNTQARLTQTRELKKYIKSKLSSTQIEFTHYFPAWTLGMELQDSFQIGPVEIISKMQWIKNVDFSENAKNNFANLKDQNFNWKEILISNLQNRIEDALPLEGLAQVIYAPLEKCSSLLKIMLLGYEIELSKKVARLICKSALDSISLLFYEAVFHQQSLQDERLLPIDSYSLIETNKFLWGPGMKISDRIKTIPHTLVRKNLQKSDRILEAIGEILNAMQEPKLYPNPKLAARWCTALDWLAEGCREINDAIAVAKIATSLDVLACGGKFSGILAMLEHLTGENRDTVVIPGENSRTLQQLVKDIYDSCRSKILHGEEYDRLASFEKQRHYAYQLSRSALIECALRLKQYAGPDDDKAFRNIPP